MPPQASSLDLRPSKEGQGKAGRARPAGSRCGACRQAARSRQEPGAPARSGGSLQGAQGLLVASAGASARLLACGESGAGAAPANAGLEEEGDAPPPPLGAGNVLTSALILQNVSDAVGDVPNRDVVRALVLAELCARKLADVRKFALDDAKGWISRLGLELPAKETLTALRQTLADARREGLRASKAPRVVEEEEGEGGGQVGPLGPTEGLLEIR
ncbi:hypothetical protein T484DRAFT_1970947 [Baffinella frigidus]|nr:hypothetical protein T484DRAFT_1970947 [Cryptophyta sp. CCMP2293]